MRTTSLLATLALSSSLIGCADDSEPYSEPDVLALPGPAYYPESVHADPGGTLYVGSLTTGDVVAFDPGATEARLVVHVAEYGVTGVQIHADQLWLCAVDLAFQRATEIRSFTLAGEPLLAVALPPTAFCNDFAFDAADNLYVADSFGTVQRLAAGASSFEVFASDPRFVPDSMGAFGLDGIVALDDALIVNKLDTGELFRIGFDATITEISVVPVPLASPDGMRLLDDGRLVVVEGGAGRLSRLTITGNEALLSPLAFELDMPTGVAIARGSAWVTEGQLGKLFANESPNLPFAVRRIDL